MFLLVIKKFSFMVISKFNQSNNALLLFFTKKILVQPRVYQYKTKDPVLKLLKFGSIFQLKKTSTNIELELYS